MMSPQDLEIIQLQYDTISEKTPASRAGQLGTIIARQSAAGFSRDASEARAWGGAIED
jgi:hypothetical protein